MRITIENDGYAPPEFWLSDKYKDFSAESKYLFTFLLANAESTKVVFETARFINSFKPAQLEKVKKEVDRCIAAEKVKR